MVKARQKHIMMDYTASPLSWIVVNFVVTAAKDTITTMQGTITVYMQIAPAVNVVGMNIPKDVFSSQDGVTRQSHVKNVTDSSMLKIATKHIWFKLNRKKPKWKKIWGNK